MIQCKCGGIVRQYALTNAREVWTCKSCGRYEVTEKSEAENKTPPEKKVNE